MPDVTLRMINQLEQTLLEFLNYDLVVKGSEYAKYYFILRTLDEDIKRETPIHLSSKMAHEGSQQNAWGEFPLKEPISAQKMIELQRNSAKAEIILKEKHEREFEAAFRTSLPTRSL